jgi:hypothetical protein
MAKVCSKENKAKGNNCIVAGIKFYEQAIGILVFKTAK